MLANNIRNSSSGILILMGWVEQIYKGYKTKRLKDVSKFLMIFIAAGSILWLIYGVIVEDVFIIGTNMSGLILMHNCIRNEEKIRHSSSKCNNQNQGINTIQKKFKERCL